MDCILKNTNNNFSMISLIKNVLLTAFNGLHIWFQAKFLNSILIQSKLMDMILKINGPIKWNLLRIRKDYSPCLRFWTNKNRAVCLQTNQEMLLALPELRSELKGAGKTYIFSVRSIGCRACVCPFPSGFTQLSSSEKYIS